MAHDIQHLFENISKKSEPRRIDIIQSDINDLENLMCLDRRKIALANMHKKKEKLELELSRAKKQVEAQILDKIK